MKENKKEFPELLKRKRSMIEIVGLKNKENINSNYLAYYFDEKSEHGLGRLFLDALLKAVKTKSPDFDESIYTGDFIVKKEEKAKDANGKGRIDILIKSKYDNWAIIIENKIYSDVHNPLKTYINSLKLGEKQGVLLTLWKLDKHYADFVNITHNELIKQVQQEFSKIKIEERQLFFLKDFILNVENYYFYEREDVKEVYQKRLIYYINNNIEKESITRDINSVLKRILNKSQFTNNTTKETTYWLYYNKNFQIHYDTNLILKNKRISLRFAIEKSFFDKHREKIKLEEIKYTYKDEKFVILCYENLEFNDICKNDINYIDWLNEITTNFINKYKINN